MRSITCYIVLIVFMCIPLLMQAQSNNGVLKDLLQVPRQYTVAKTTEKLAIDGLAKEDVWARAPWTEYFTDIKGNKDVTAPQATRCKMLWDDEYLYVYALFNETDIWAKITEHDAPIYHENAFEIFIDPDGDTHDYVEFQINANQAIFDFFFPKPYRNGGRGVKDFEIKGLKKAVHINGTLNDPSDKDKFWSIELAFPLKSLATNQEAITPGTIWRMNFSRVQWDLEIINNAYQKKRDVQGKFKEAYWVWSPQGIVNLHYPERWGYVKFGEESNQQQGSPSFLNQEIEELKLQIWKYYYLQQDYKQLNGKYALNLAQLQGAFPKVAFASVPGLYLNASADQFIVGIKSGSPDRNFLINEQGKFTSKMNKED